MVNPDEMEPIISPEGCNDPENLAQRKRPQPDCEGCPLRKKARLGG